MDVLPGVVVDGQIVHGHVPGTGVCVDVGVAVEVGVVVGVGVSVDVGVAVDVGVLVAFTSTVGVTVAVGVAVGVSVGVGVLVGLPAGPVSLTRLSKFVFQSLLLPTVTVEHVPIQLVGMVCTVADGIVTDTGTSEPQLRVTRLGSVPPL